MHLKVCFAFIINCFVFWLGVYIGIVVLLCGAVDLVLIVVYFDSCT